jgi:hypothetical protein
VALPEEILVFIAKNQFTKDPYEADMLNECLSAVKKYYHKHNDNLLDKTLKIVTDNLAENVTVNALTVDNLTSDTIKLLQPKELLEVKIKVLGAGKISTDEREKVRLRKLYKLIEEKLSLLVDKEKEV